MAAGPGKCPREGAAAQGYFHELLSSKGGVGVLSREVDSTRRRQGLGYLVKAPVTPTSIFWPITGWSGTKLSCGRLHLSAPCFRRGMNRLVCSGCLSESAGKSLKC